MKQQSRVRPAPRRTCVVCREVREKIDLIRVVRTPQGQIEVDEAGKKSGRGAYICRSWACWEAGLKRNRLARALKTNVGPEHYTDLWEYAEKLRITPGNGTE